MAFKWGWLKCESGLSNELYFQIRNKPRSNISRAASGLGLMVIHCIAILEYCGCGCKLKNHLLRMYYLMLYTIGFNAALIFFCYCLWLPKRAWKCIFSFSIGIWRTGSSPNPIGRYARKCAGVYLNYVVCSVDNMWFNSSAHTLDTSILASKFFQIFLFTRLNVSSLYKIFV